MIYFLVSYIEVKHGKEQKYITVFREESLHSLHKHCVKYNYVIMYVSEITSDEANEIWDIEKYQKNPYSEDI